jgi:hypothetical protein
VRLAETLGDAADGAAIGTAVEEVGSLEESDLPVGELAQDRLLLRERALLRAAGEAEEVDEVPLAAPAAAAFERSLIQPASIASSWQSGQTSTSSAPSDGAKLTARSPIKSVRSHTAQARVVATFVTLIGVRV